MQSTSANYTAYNNVTHDTDTYNDCFVLSGIYKNENGSKRKQCYYIQDGKAHVLSIKHKPDNIIYRQLTYDNAQQTLDNYFAFGKRTKSDDTLRVSIWLENAKYGSLSLFCIDFDEYNENSDFFKSAYMLADKITRSQSNGYHMWYGIDRQKAEPLFKNINLTTREGTKSFVCNIGNITDGNKVDLFCENGRLIHEFEKWDNNTGLTDKTIPLFELLNTSFTFKEKSSIDYWQNAEGKSIDIEGLPEDLLLEKMTDKQRIVFEKLKAISPDCTQREWYRIGVDIKHVFGDEFGGSVFLWWSKAGLTFQDESLANTWNDICNRKNALWNNEWAEIIGIEINAFDLPIPDKSTRAIKQQIENNDKLKAAREERRRQAEAELKESQARFEAETARLEELNNNPLFRGKPIKWVTVDRMVRTNNAFDLDEVEENGKNHLIEYEQQTYKREEFIKTMFPEYKKHSYKVIFNNDDVFYLGNNQRAKLQYQILASKFDTVTVSDKDKEDLERFCVNYNGETAQRWYNRMKWEQGHEKMITFGVSLDVRRKDGTTKANGIWCYSAEMTNTYAIYSGKPMTWELWSAQLIDFLDKKRDEYKDNRLENYAAVYNEAAILMYYQSGKYMTLPAQERKDISNWIYEYYMYNSKPLFPLNGEIPGKDRVVTIIFDDVEIVKAYNLRSEMSAYNKEHNAEHNDKMWHDKTKDRFDQLEGDKWTTQEIIAQGFSRKTLDTFVRRKFIKRVKQGHYVRNSV